MISEVKSSQKTEKVLIELRDLSASKVVAARRQCPSRPTPTSTTAYTSIFTDTSNAGWGTNLGDFTARALWSVSGKETDNAPVVATIKNGRGFEFRLSLCPTLKTPVVVQPENIVIQARHIPGRLNVIADLLSHHNQVIQTELSLHQRIFDQICPRWHTPQIDVFTTRFSKKLARFACPVPNKEACQWTL